MNNPIAEYTRWLHTRWPAGTVEKLPVTGENGITNLPGVRIAGDLSGIPLLKFSSQTATKAVRAILKEPDFQKRDTSQADVLDIAIIGAGVAGVSAGIEAKKAQLRFAVYEATQLFSTVVNFPKAKPIYTYPTELKLDGGLIFHATVKEALVEEMETQQRAAGIEPVAARIERLERSGNLLVLHHEDGKTTRAHRVIVALGRSGNFRKLGCSGENLDKVYNRLFDPKEFAGKEVLVVGGGDTALETAIAIAACGGRVTLSYRKKEFARPKPDNVEKLQMLVKDPAARVAVEHPTSERVTTAANSYMRGDKAPGCVQLMMQSAVQKIEPTSVTLLDATGNAQTILNDVVFTMLGREAPLDFFRRSGIPIRGEWSAKTWVSFLAFFAFCCFVYIWKASSHLNQVFQQRHWFPFDVPGWLHAVGGSIATASADPRTLLGTLTIDLASPGFYYSMGYTLAIIAFGLRRIKRRNTDYVRLQTYSLMAFQFIPLFLLPYIVLPLMGHNGWFDSGVMKTIADNLFPAVNYEHGREYWRAFGFVLAWPLFIWNVFTSQPLWWWLGISFLQTFVVIPLIVYRWGKGAYCGWVCSCGGLAETMGDTHREKMPHGPFWNRLNMAGQVILLAALLIAVFRFVGWMAPNSALGRTSMQLSSGLLNQWSVLGVELNYYHVVDIGIAGIIGLCMYFWFSGRVWCRFACPLAALMHIYARFSRYRIFPEKKKCISCNVCTSVCHQGIDVMNFANKGMPMEDPECVRCSACVQMCPTGVLTFGRFDSDGKIVYDKLVASPVQMREAH
ncbi:MAG TPA: NAD(P)-binding domain-containing protein [Candidatus Acidoferrum sp.]|jgi:thioredoxin reductase/ferredoxin|nr:NAD(P)-binding domain-containing protein [Candidatus Acidoferrum sp.]